jgi:hypothetical protein
LRLAFREPLALAGADLLALERHRLHAPAEAVALEKRLRHSVGGRGRRNADQHRRHELGVAEPLINKIEHVGARL